MDIIVHPKVNIVFTPRVKEYLEKNNIKEITIEAIDISSCCIPLVAPPEVRKGAPKEPKRYLLIEKDGVNIYYQRNLPIRPQVTIDIRRFGFIKVLKINDWEIRF